MILRWSERKARVASVRWRRSAIERRHVLLGDEFHRPVHGLRRDPPEPVRLKQNSGCSEVFLQFVDSIDNLAWRTEEVSAFEPFQAGGAWIWRWDEVAPL